MGRQRLKRAGNGLMEEVPEEMRKHDWREGCVFERRKARVGQDDITIHHCHMLHICTSAIAALLPLSYLFQDRAWERWGPHLGTSQKCVRILMLEIFISGNMELMAARTEVWVPLRPCQSTPHTN